MSNDAYEYMKMLLNVNKNAKLVIECELHANVRFLALLRQCFKLMSHPSEEVINLGSK